MESAATIKRCPLCNYRLDGLPAEHRCPECGLSFNDDTLTFKPSTQFPLVRLVVCGSLVLMGVAILMRSGGSLRGLALFNLGIVFVITAIRIRSTSRARRTLVILSKNEMRVTDGSEDLPCLPRESITSACWSFVTGNVCVHTREGRTIFPLGDDFFGTHKNKLAFVDLVNDWAEANQPPEQPSLDSDNRTT